MSTAEAPYFTSEDLFAAPSNDKEKRWLFQGQLRVDKMTKRNPHHSHSMVRISQFLANWLDQQTSTPMGAVVCGECYFRIRTEPETNIDVDVALTTAEQAASIHKRDTFIEGPPVLIAEILSPYDKQKDIQEKIDEYLECGVKLVWVVNPHDQTVTVYRANQDVVLFNHNQQLAGFAELPGFICPVRSLFL